MTTLQDPPVATPVPHFQLLRYFSVASLLGLLAAMTVLVLVFRENAMQQLTAYETDANANITRALANAVWADHRRFVLDSGGWQRDQLLAEPAQSALAADVRRILRDVNVAKFKIYNRDGLTVYSSDPRQIGEDKRADPGFRAALAGAAVSGISYREEFAGFDGILHNRQLLASYVPVGLVSGGLPEGVVEVYADVTDELDQQRRAQWRMTAIVGGALGLLYLFLFFVVRKADRILAAQAQAQDARERDARRLALHDALTGLPNRTFFAQRLDEVLALAKRHDHICALLFVDLDQFKAINDEHGHAAGDEVLREAGRRIRVALRAGDQVFRMGGDEFNVVLPKVAHVRDAELVVRRIEAAFASPINVDGMSLFVGASIGVAVWPEDGDDVEVLQRSADAAMYRAKAERRDQRLLQTATAAAPTP